MTTDESLGTLAVHRLPLYNPARLKDAEIIAAFIARKPLLERITADLDAEKPQSIAQHHLIVGQRGMGKTLLLARIAAELRSGSLAPRFIPLVFAEEQYAVDRLSKFWLNCLDSLADEHDRAGAQNAVRQIDDTVQRFTTRLSGAGGDDALAREVLEAFLQAAEATGRRPVLLVDNLQIVFERLTQEEQHSLREVLMRPGCPVLVGASPSPPLASQDYGAAFYDHFKVHYLRPLALEEMKSVLLHLASAVAREDVRQRVANHPERLAVLRQLTGGNPRTTVTLFFLYAEDFAPTVFGDLENLLDRVTPLYKAIFEELSPQQQVLASAIANHWDPVTARLLAEHTGLAPHKITPQLDRLEKIGFIEKVELFNTVSTGYQIAERFFNVWFLMRSASRRQRREVEFLTRFLQAVYEAPERDRLALHLMSERNFSSDRYLLSCAVADSLPNSGVGEDLKRHAQLDVLRQQNREARRKLAEILDLSTLPPATLAFDQLRRRLAALVPLDAQIAPDQFAEQILGDRQMFRDGERERLAARSEKLSAEAMTSTLEVVGESQKFDKSFYSDDAVDWFSNRLVSGQLRSAQDVEDWNRAFQTAKTRESFQLMVDTLPAGLGHQLSNETFERIRRQLTPAEDAAASRWFNWGYDLHVPLERYAEAEIAYREAIACDPQDAAPWHNLGNLLQVHLQRYAEAEVAYREAIARDPQDASPWNGLGTLLQEHLQRYAEAETAYREAIARDPQDASPWNGLGNLLQEHLQRYAEAETAYREAIARDHKLAGPWNGLGNLLKNHLQRYAEAEVAYREAIARDHKLALPWYGLGNLLQEHLQRYAEAETAYREAIARDPQYASPWNGLGTLLQEHLQRYAEAETAYREAIARDPQDAGPWNNLGTLLQDHLQRYAEAEVAYREAIACDPQLALPWNGLGNLLQDHLQRYAEAEVAYREAIARDPQDALPWNGLGNLLCDHLQRFDDAAAAYARAIELDPTNEYTHQNLIFLHRDFLGEAVAARPLLDRLTALSKIELIDTLRLHQALFSAYEANWGLAMDSLTQALEIAKDGFPPETTDDWMRASAVLLHLNYGAELLSFLEARGDQARLRPWYEALKALHLGDRRYLHNIAPEIRTTAEKFYDQIERRLQVLPASTRRRPLPPEPKRKKRAKSVKS